ncbi:PAS domain-containing protein [Sphingomonas sp. A2-49]|uniref:PAS domain-containing protein n=1 Tax=Sphingomonas sp. A2-49 TaxID=1391375 RepID=UPI0021D3681A|nr:PAS domain-containing protein [Sphingomonas sp. A2-49]MCU6455535.1 PAS domain-containing protein [Sphingomonas sp. A2-49]
MRDALAADGSPASPRCSEARLRFLLRLGDALRPLDDVGAIQALVARMLVEEMEADRGGYADVRSDGDTVELEWRPADDGGFPTPAHWSADIGRPVHDRLCSGRIDLHQDVADDASLGAAERHAYAAMDVAAAVNVPVLDAGRLRAFFFLHHRRPRPYSDGELDFLRETAERAGFAIEDARTKAALRDSEARLLAALESVPAGIAMLDTSGRIVLANAEYRQFLPSGVIPSRDPAGVGRWQAWDDDGHLLTPTDYPGARAMRGERTVPGQEMLFSIDATRRIWTRVASVPIYDAAGRINGQASVISDIDALKRNSEALRESQARAQLLIDGIAAATWEAAPDGLVEADSPSWRAFTGQAYDEWKGYGWLTAIHPSDRTATVRTWREAVRARRPIDAEYRLRRADGQYRWMNVRAVPLRNDAGRIEKWLGLNIDIDARKRLEQSLGDNERRTRALVEGIPQLLWRAGRATRLDWASPQWTAFTGQTEQDSRARGWLDMVHPDDRDAVLAAWEGAAAGAGFEIEHRLRHRDGRYRWFATRGVPVIDEAGDIVEWLGTANDIDALRDAQAGQEIMVAELQHRTRNLIAVVRALSEKTLDGATSLADFARRFNHRLSSLARVQGLLSHTKARGRVMFDELLRSELSALGGSDSDGLDARITLRGPRGIPLRSSAVQTLALALHELATNAVKHGALASATGRLEIGWSIERDDAPCPSLFIEWTETGVSAHRAGGADAPSGYGRELIERALPFQLKAKTSYALTADGLRCTVTVPIISTQTGKEGP